MPSKTVTFSFVDVVEGVSKKTNKPYTRYDLKTTHNERFKTFKEGIGTVALARKGEAVEIEYEETVNGEFVDRLLTGIKPSDSAGSGDSAPAQGAATSSAPAARQDERQSTINRSAALARAIEAIGSGVVNLPTDDIGNTNISGIFQLADAFVPYIEGQTQEAEATDDGPNF